MDVAILLFDQYETLDAMGPAEIFGSLPNTAIHCLSLDGGPVQSAQGVVVMTHPVSHWTEPMDIALLPGGQSTLSLQHNPVFLHHLTRLANAAEWMLTVCTGSVLLAQTGLLDGRQATSNKSAWQAVIDSSDKVNWQHKARWCVDGKYYTSSGVSAGMDMSLGFIADRLGRPRAYQLANGMEYRWHEDAADDPFAVPQDQ
ncbi:DJ-1/PfpI family protein [Sodalis endosymbiont of Spalangia cameroni]|uniref:DJ-1/PfpI family protein n=1 Tax=Sodalis praecaptivus TaxID=1239307 RepID=UPI0031F7DCB9